MPEANNARKNEFTEGVTRLPQPVTVREHRDWRTTAIGFNALTQGNGFKPAEMRHQNLKDVREGRTRYASLPVKKEIAAATLAAGGTVRQAAAAIGATRAAVRRYLQEEAFRERVGELQAQTSTVVTGRILQEFEKRTSKSEIEKLEVLDLTRILDRVQSQTPHAKDEKRQTEEAHDGDEYHWTLQQIINVDAGAEGEDFPAFTAEDLRLSGGDPSE